jgi:hypothetical protein
MTTNTENTAAAPTAQNADGLFYRGVYRQPFLGPNGEMVLIAITSEHKRLEEVLVSIDDNPFDASDQLWDRLDKADPAPTLEE